MAKFCGQCGSPMGQNAQFCGSCGWNSEANNIQKNKEPEVQEQGYTQVNSGPVNQGGNSSYSQQSEVQEEGYTQVNSGPVNQGSSPSYPQQPVGQPSYAQPMDHGGHPSYAQQPVKKSKLKGCLIVLIIIGLILFGLFKGFGFVVQKLKDLGISVPNIEMPFGSSVNKEAAQDDYLGIWEGTLRFDVDNINDMPDLNPDEVELVKEALDAEHSCILEVTEDGLILTMYINFKGNIEEEEMDELIYEVIDGVLYAVIPEEEMDGGTATVEMMITELNSPKRLLGRMQFQMPMPNGKLGSMGVDIDLYQ